MDYLGAQGYWICTLIAVVAFVFSLAVGHAITGFVFLLFYYLGGVGIREHSRFAAAVVLVLYGAAFTEAACFILRRLPAAVRPTMLLSEPGAIG